MEVLLVQEGPDFELLDGRLYPRHRVDHARMSARQFVYRVVAPLAAGHGAVVIGPTVRLGWPDSDTVLAPDVIFLEGESEVPDLVFEVRGPHDDEVFRRRKVGRMLEAGTRLVVEVDPLARTLRAFGAAGSRLFGPGDRFVTEAFGWLAFDVNAAFEPT